MCEAVFGGIDIGHFVESFGQHIVRYFGVYLGRLDVRMSQHSTDHLDADALRQRVGRGERVAGHMIGYRLVDADLRSDLFQYSVAVGDVGHGQHEVRPRNFTLVTGDDALGNAAQFDFERRVGLLPPLDDPQIAVERTLNHLLRQPLDVGMGHPRKTREDEHVAHLAIALECEFMVHQRLQFGFDEVAAFFGCLLRVVIGERIAGDHACVVRFRDDHLQWLGVDADARGRQAFLSAQIEVVVGDERFGQLFQRNILAMQFLAKELRQSFAHVVVFAIGGLRPVYADMLFEIAIELVERFQQCFILFAHAEVSQLYALGRNVGVAVGDALVMPLDLSADMLQLTVDRLRLVAFACGFVGFGIPQGGRQGETAVDERASTVHRQTGVNRNTPLFHALFVHIEQDFECASSHNRFTGCKVNRL